jgi:tight adherence protein C
VRKLKFVNDKKIRRIIGEDLFSRINREIDAVGKVKILIFTASSIEELFSICTLLIVLSLAMIALGIVTNRLSTFAVLAIAILGGAYLSYKDPIDKYKNRLMQDNELPSVLETLVSGLSVGMPIESIMKYISENKKGYMRDIIYNSLNLVNSGIPLEQSLQEAAYKSMNKYFERAVRILSKSDETIAGLAEQLNELLKDIEEERINKKTEKASSLDNIVALPILIGYFIPLLVVIMYPFLVDFSQMMNFK